MLQRFPHLLSNLRLCRTLSAVLFAMAAAMGTPATGWALSAEEVQKLTAFDGAETDIFGGRLSMFGDTAVVGVVNDDDEAENAGSAYIFIRGADGTWILQQKLTAGDGHAFDGFGSAVSLVGDTVLIAASGDDDNGVGSGSAYVFVRGADGVWIKQQKLSPLDPAPGQSFGSSVSLSGDAALIGAYRDNDNGNSSGAAYVFTRSGGTWTQQQKLTAGDGAALDIFGITVSLFSDTALIGAPSDDDNGPDSGSAYVFTRSGGIWTQQQKLIAGDGAENDFFGSYVSVVGDTALITASGDDSDTNGLSSGSAYVFIRGADGSWTRQQKLTASDGAAFDRFGVSAALFGDIALIGAPGDDVIGSNSGSAYLFTRSSGIWSEQQKLTPSDGAESDGFGGAVGLSGDTAMVGAGGDDDNGPDSGSAYVFNLSEGILVAPLSHDFGQIDAFTSQDAIVTITNATGGDLTVDSVAITAGASSFSIAAFDPPVTPPFTLAPGGDVFVTVTFLPTSEGVHAGTLSVASSDPENPVVDVSLIGNGLVGAVEDQATVLEAAVDEAVVSGTLVGTGSGNSSSGRLGAFDAMLESAGDLIEAGLTDEACGQLRTALKRVDGDPRPPDFVEGEEAALIAAEIAFLMDSLGCR